MKAIIEMPQGSSYKYEVNKNTKRLILDRTLNQKIPCNYGYLEETLSEDLDPLDLFLVSEDPIPPLTEVQVEILGVFKCKDNGIQDDKIIGYIKGDSVVAEFLLKQYLVYIEAYLSTYKENFIVETYETASQAIKIYKESSDNYKLSNLNHNG